MLRASGTSKPGPQCTENIASTHAWSITESSIEPVAMGRRSTVTLS